MQKDGGSASPTQFFEFVIENWEPKEAGQKPAKAEPQKASSGSEPPKTETSSDTPPKRYGKRLVIGGDAAYQAKVVADLDKLASLSTGKTLLASLEQTPHDVSIVPCPPGKEAATPSPPYEALIDRSGRPVTVTYSATQFPMYKSGADWDEPPPSIILGHELIHASHMANGNMEGLDYEGGATVPTYRQNRMGRFQALEERRTVGLPQNDKLNFQDYTKEPFTENKLRAEMKEPLRTSYLDPKKGRW